MSLWTLALLVLLVTLPFGYWRASARRHSRQWLLAMELPVPLVVALIFWGPGFGVAGFAVGIAAFALGQFVGGRLRNIIQGRGPGRPHH